MKKALKILLTIATIGLGCLLLLIGISSVHMLVVENQTPEQAAPKIGHWIQAGDVNLYVQEFGNPSSPALVLTHGTGAWSGTWISNINAMVDVGYRVIAIDTPPFGYSTKPAKQNYNRHDQALRILAAMDSLKLNQVTLLGHSYGGGPAAEVAMLASDRVSHLILVDAAIGLDKVSKNTTASNALNGILAIRPLRTALVATVGTQPALSTTLLKSFVARKEVVTEQRTAIYTAPFVLSSYTEGLGDWAYQFANENGKSLSEQAVNFKKLKIPVTLLWGAEDMITPMAQALQLKALIPNAKLITLPRVGHIPQIEDVDLFNQEIAKVLQSTLQQP